MRIHYGSLSLEASQLFNCLLHKLWLIPYTLQTTMVKKDKKTKDADKKARVAAKQSKKSAQKEKKVKSKEADDSDAEDVDLESVLEEYAKQVGNTLCLFKAFKASWNGFKPLIVAASPIHQSHRDSLPTSISSIVGHPHWFTIQCEGAFPFWGRIL